MGKGYGMIETMINIDGLIALIDKAPNREAAMALLDALKKLYPEQTREAELRLLQGRPEIKVTTYGDLS